MKSMTALAVCLLPLLVGCEEQALLAVGQLESDRVELVAEYSEAIVAIHVKEGDELAIGAGLVTQDNSRIEIQILEAQSNIQRVGALLQEQINGPLPETIAVLEATLAEAAINRDFKERELARLTRLRAQNLTSIESVDSAQSLLDAANARMESIRAQLAELRVGTRPEKIEQTRHQLQQAEAQLQSLQLNRQRLQITAPVDGIVDSLPFEVGERPRIGDVLAVLLTGEQPYARLYIPESVRADIRPGSILTLSIDGVNSSLPGSVRHIASEASFTPYFALTERDRGRLSYVAEVELPDLPTRLPDGLPVQVIFGQVPSP